MYRKSRISKISSRMLNDDNDSDKQKISESSRGHSQHKKSRGSNQKESKSSPRETFDYRDVSSMSPKSNLKQKNSETKASGKDISRLKKLSKISNKKYQTKVITANTAMAPDIQQITEDEEEHKVLETIESKGSPKKDRLEVS
jgi:hypothetical protein